MSCSILVLYLNRSLEMKDFDLLNFKGFHFIYIVCRITPFDTSLVTIIQSYSCVKFQ